MASLKEVTEQLESLRYQAHQIYSEAGPELDFSKVKCVPGTTQEKLAKFQALQMEMTDVGAEHDRLKAVEASLKANEMAYQLDNNPVNSPFSMDSKGFDFQRKPESIKSLLTNSPEFKTLRERKAGTARIEIPEFKTLIQLSGISPQNTRVAPVNMRLEERTVIDMIGESQANSATVEWYEETTVTNAAVEVTEGSSKPEAALAWTLRSTPIATIAVWIPVTVQALDDNDFLEEQIRNRLTFMVQRREEVEVLTGDGISPNITGLLVASNVQTQAKGADAVPTAIMKGIQKIRGAGGSGFAEPDGIVMHPNDVTDLITLQATDGSYIWQALLQQQPEFRLWGLPIRQTTAMTENTALVGAFALGAEVYRRGGLSIAASTEHSTYFTENKVAIRAESRIGLAVPIPTAFCKVTGI